VERERDEWKRERCEGRHQANENGAEKVVNGKERRESWQKGRGWATICKIEMGKSGWERGDKGKEIEERRQEK
jgi:hypothetical protein